MFRLIALFPILLNLQNEYIRKIAVLSARFLILAAGQLGMMGTGFPVTCAPSRVREPAIRLSFKDHGSC